MQLCYASSYQGKTRAPGSFFLIMPTLTKELTFRVTMTVPTAFSCRSHVRVLKGTINHWTGRSKCFPP